MLENSEQICANTEIVGVVRTKLRVDDDFASRPILSRFAPKLILLRK